MKRSERRGIARRRLKEKMKITMSDGSQVNAISVPFKVRKEEFNEYELADGSLMRVKFVLLKALKSEAKQPQSDENVWMPVGDVKCAVDERE